MNQNEAKLKLVKAAVELKVGDGLVLKNCRYGCRQHVFNITKIEYRNNCRCFDFDYTITIQSGEYFHWSPPFFHKDYPELSDHFLNFPILEKRLYKIIDEAPKEADTDVVVERTRPKVKEGSFLE